MCHELCKDLQELYHKSKFIHKCKCLFKGEEQKSHVFACMYVKRVSFLAVLVPSFLNWSLSSPLYEEVATLVTCLETSLHSPGGGGDAGAQRCFLHLKGELTQKQFKRLFIDLAFPETRQGNCVFTKACPRQVSRGWGGGSGVFARN